MIHISAHFESLVLLEVAPSYPRQQAALDNPDGLDAGRKIIFLFFALQQHHQLIRNLLPAHMANFHVTYS